MTFTNPANAKPATFDCAVLFNGLMGIAGTAWFKTATAAKNRA
jgi:hypothetical protein